jgi:hypothetical protein
MAFESSRRPFAAPAASKPIEACWVIGLEAAQSALADGHTTLVQVAFDTGDLSAHVQGDAVRPADGLRSFADVVKSALRPNMVSPVLSRKQARCWRKRHAFRALRDVGLECTF